MASPRPLRLAAVLTALALACTYGGAIAKNLLFGIAPALAPPALALAPLLYLVLTRKVAASDGLGPRAAPLTALVTAVAAPVFSAHAHLALALPMVKLRDGRDPAFIDSALVMLAVLVASILVTGLAARVLSRRDLGAVAAPLRLAAPAATTLAIALVIACAVSPRPSPDRWIASLPIIAVTPATDTGPAGHETGVGDLVIVRHCKLSTCGAWLQHRGEHVQRGPDVSSTRAVQLRRDEAHDLWTLDASSGVETRFIDRASERAAFRGADLARTEVRPSTLAGSLAPPRGWIVAAAIGAALALWKLAGRRAAQRRLDEILGAEAGTLDEDGWITLDHGLTPVRVSTDVPPGPVLVVSPGADAGSAYRSEGARRVDRVLAGTRDELAHQARLALATLDATALASAAIASAPLAVAWLEGLR